MFSSFLSLETVVETSPILRDSPEKKGYIAPALYIP